MDMLGEVGERLGLAAENNRLYENSQRTAQREALVNEIGTRIQSANSVEATMTEAMKSLSDVLKAKHVSIQLGKPTRQ
jgi:GAF domain-containing protein